MRPMKTMTTPSAGALIAGRITTRSTTTPMANDIATVATNASQYDTPASIIAQATYVEQRASSPCAKFTKCVTR